MLITGFATFAVCLVPTYDSIGIWGAVILTIIRFIQGIGVGGEWGGSVLLSMEWARTNAHRGFITARPQFGAPAGILLANVAVLAFSWLSGDQFLVWGWRMPFLLSIVMAAVGLYIRLGVLETPAFQRLLVQKRVEQAPVLEVIRRQPKEIVLAALAKTGEIAPAYIYLAFVFVYGSQVLHAGRDFILSGVIAGCLLSFVVTPLSGYLSDRIGRKRMYLLSAIGMGIFGFIYFAMLNSLVPEFIGIMLLWMMHGLMYGPQAALIAECFTPRWLVRLSSRRCHRRRPRTLIATVLLAWTGSGYAIAGYIAACALVSIIATILMPDYTNRDISEEHA